MTLRLFVLLFLGLFAGFGAGANCGPAIVVPAGGKLSFALLDVPAGFRFQATLTEPWTLKADTVRLGLKPAGVARKLPNDLVLAMGNGAPKSFRDFKVLADAPLPPQIKAQQGGQFRSLQVLANDLLDADGRVLKFAPSSQVGLVRVKENASVMVAEGAMTLEQGTVIEWSPELSSPLEMGLGQPARIALGENAASPSRLEVLGEGRMAAGRAIKLRVTREGADFKTLEPQVCFRIGRPGDQNHVNAYATAQFVPDSIAGMRADYEVVIPRSLKAATNRWPSSAVATPVTVQAIGLGQSNDGLVFDAQANFSISNAYTSLGLSLLVLLAVLLLAGMFLGTYKPLTILTRLLEGKSGRFSLSNLQILLWTLLVLFSMSYVWINQGEMMALTEGILALLGISGGTSVLARFAAGTGSSGSPPAPVVETGGDNALSALLQSEDGQFDLLRFQMLGFTVFTWLYALISVVRTDGFPEIPENLYYLMGLSSATYLLGKTQKATSTPPPAPAPAGQVGAG